MLLLKEEKGKCLSGLFNIYYKTFMKPEAALNLHVSSSSLVFGFFFTFSPAVLRRCNWPEADGSPSKFKDSNWALNRTCSNYNSNQFHFLSIYFPISYGKQKRGWKKAHWAMFAVSGGQRNCSAQGKSKQTTALFRCTVQPVVKAIWLSKAWIESSKINADTRLEAKIIHVPFIFFSYFHCCGKSLVNISNDLVENTITNEEVYDWASKSLRSEQWNPLCNTLRLLASSVNVWQLFVNALLLYEYVQRKTIWSIRTLLKKRLHLLTNP